MRGLSHRDAISTLSGALDNREVLGDHVMVDPLAFAAQRLCFLYFGANFAWLRTGFVRLAQILLIDGDSSGVQGRASTELPFRVEGCRQRLEGTAWIDGVSLKNRRYEYIILQATVDSTALRALGSLFFSGYYYKIHLKTW